MISRNFITRFFVVALCFFMLAGCGGGDDPIIPASGSVTVSITVLSLPATVTYNNTALLAEVNLDKLEYEWGVSFDVNGDGLINTGDIVLNLSHYKTKDSTQTTGAISGFSARAWLYTSDTTQFLIPGDLVTATIVGNTITLSINRDDFTTLVGVNAATKVRFRTAYWDPAIGLLTYDYYKDLAATVNEYIGSNTVNYTDDIGVDDTNSPDPMIDMQTMTLTFTD